ncbi:MAG: hypothetical protein ACRD0U_13245, partial [Acidimicrobiales bacterium]
MSDGPACVDSYFGVQIVGNQFAGSPDCVRLNDTDSTRLARVEGNTFNLTASGEVLDLSGQVSSVIVRSSASNSVVRGNTFGPTVRAVKVEDGSTGNRIEENSYVGVTAGAAIDLLPGDGRTPNDPGDADEGGNRLQNFPVITTAGAESVAGTLDST